MVAAFLDHPRLTARAGSLVLSWALRLKRRESATVKDKTLLKTGIIGGAVAAICCVTPILVVAVSA